MSFNDYWKAKAAKRRKAWAATSKRFADEHAQQVQQKILPPPHPTDPQHLKHKSGNKTAKFIQSR